MARSKRIAIVQSNYIPWKGYFDLIGSVDQFILFDCVQFTKRDWRNRNKIKTKDGVRWLTIPVASRGKYYQTINETRITEHSWVAEHVAAIHHAYARARCFREVFPWLEEMFAHCRSELLSEVNEILIRAICERLGISTVISKASEFENVDGKNERLISLCKQAGATSYLSGPAARGYLDEALFADAGIAVEFMNYDGYTEYDQLHPPFEHAVSIVDLIMNVGSDAGRYLKCRL